jgi:cytochrome c1
MKSLSLILSLVLVAIAGVAAAGVASPARDAILATFAVAAKQGDPAFAGFSAERGHAFWTAAHTGGKPDTPSCTTCHTTDPTREGQTRAGKQIAPMAVSQTPDRFTDSAKVEKWFGRNCNSVLGRDCTAVEKGDVIAYLSGK